MMLYSFHYRQSFFIFFNKYKVELVSSKRVQREEERKRNRNVLVINLSCFQSSLNNVRKGKRFGGISIFYFSVV